MLPAFHIKCIGSPNPNIVRSKMNVISSKDHFKNNSSPILHLPASAIWRRWKSIPESLKNWLKSKSCESEVEKIILNHKITLVLNFIWIAKESKYQIIPKFFPRRSIYTTSESACSQESLATHWSCIPPYMWNMVTCWKYHNFEEEIHSVLPHCYHPKFCNLDYKVYKLKMNQMNYLHLTIESGHKLMYSSNVP